MKGNAVGNEPRERLLAGVAVGLALGAGLWPKVRLRAVERWKAELKPRCSAVTSKARSFCEERRLRPMDDFVISETPFNLVSLCPGQMPADALVFMVNPGRFALTEDSR